MCVSDFDIRLLPSEIDPREQEAWSVVRISIGQNSKQCKAMLTLA